MTFGQYWVIMQKRWKLVLACFLVVGLSAFVVSKLMKPTYQSTVLVQVVLRSVNNQSDYNSLLASDQLVQTESQLAISDPVLREVASHYQALTVEELSKQVTSTSKLNTQLLEIDVQDPSPTQAAVLANDIAATLIKQQTQLTQQDNSQSQQQLQQELNSTGQQIDNTTNQITTLQGQTGKQAQIAVLQARLNGLQQHYNQLQMVVAQLKLTEAQSGSFLRIAQPAQPNIIPVRPQILLNTSVGLVSGLLLGMLLVALFEQLDTRVRTPEALAELLGWPVLATISHVGSSNKDDIINPTDYSTNIESYRILRTNIGFTGLDKPLRSLVVTSPMPGDGKSTIAANLAIFIAKAGKSTLLIDADLRRPTVHEKFGLSAEKMGLTNAVLACSHLPLPSPPSFQAIPPSFSLDPYMHSVGIPNLRVMPSGPLPPNPPELLESKAMECLSLAIANCGAEIVIFDTPPLLGLSDTSILAPKTDGTLVVADIRRATKGNLKQVKALLAQAGVHVLGCAVNNQAHKRRDAAYSYYYSRAENPKSNGQSNGHHSMNNGNFPAAPVTPVLQLPANQQRMHSNQDSLN